MVVGAIAGGAGIGAGVGVSSVALAPFNAANTFMGSAFFGYGMILGERYMYQADWPKIQQRLENGEKIENIIQEYTGRFTAVVMAEAKIIFESVTKEFIEIMRKSFAPEGTIMHDMLDALGIHEGHETTSTTTTAPPPTSETSGGTTGGVTLPPTEIPKTDAQLIQESFGKIRSAVSNGALRYSIWSHIGRTGNAYTDWVKISGTNTFERNLSAAKAYGHTAWPTTSYYLKIIGNEWYYLLK